MSDPVVNFAASTVATAPIPQTSGLSLTLATGQGARFPQPSTDGAFNVVLVPPNTTIDNYYTVAEIARVSARAGDVLTFSGRAQEAPGVARAVAAGWFVILVPTAKFNSDLQSQFDDQKKWINVRDYGAVGDTSNAAASTTAASTTVTCSVGIPASANGKTMVIDNAGGAYGTYMPLVGVISGANGSTTVTLSVAATITTSSNNMYYGTDDSNAFIAARNAWYLTAWAGWYGSNERPMYAGLYIPAPTNFGRYLITQQNALLDSPTTGTPIMLRDGHITGGHGSASPEIIFATTVSTTADPRNGNLMTAANRLRSFTMSNLRINSRNPNQTMLYLWCSSANDGTYPLYGSGAQNDLAFENVQLAGKWANGWVFDGDTAANLNSEMSFRRCGAYGSYRNAIIYSGLSHTAQGDQFLNYWFYDCRWEYDFGGDMRFDKGGYITCIGGSYISGLGEYPVTNKVASAGTATLTMSGKHELYVGQTIGVDINDASLDGVQTVTAVTATTVSFASGATIVSVASGGFVGGGAAFWNMGDYPHFSNVMHLTVIGTRFEARNPAVQLVDSCWAGTTAHAEFVNITMASDSLTYVTTNYKFASIRQNNGNYGNVMGSWLFRNCELPGYIGFVSPTANPNGGSNNGGILIDQCNFRHNSGGIGTSTGFIRHDGTHIPKYYYNRCQGVASTGTYT